MRRRLTELFWDLIETRWLPWRIQHVIWVLFYRTIARWEGVQPSFFKDFWSCHSYYLKHRDD